MRGCISQRLIVCLNLPLSLCELFRLLTCFAKSLNISLLNSIFEGEKMGKVLKIEFTYDGRYETETENIGQGILIIPTMDGEYVLINFTVDGDFAEIYDDLRKLIRKVREYYGDDIAKIVKNELNEN